MSGGGRREYPANPLVAVGALVLDVPAPVPKEVPPSASLLLVKRGNPPDQGLWAVPGGKVELGERLEDALRREVLEETGIEVEVGAVAGVSEKVVQDGAGRTLYHYVIVDYWASVAGTPQVPTPTPATDVSEARWVPIVEVSEVPLSPTMRDLLEDLKVIGTRE
ncbi:MAG: NUDIX hydrolase [Promethearchaeota archaeon]